MKRGSKCLFFVSVLAAAAVCAACDEMFCSDYDFVNETEYNIEYEMTKTGAKDTIGPFQSYTRYLSEDLNIKIVQSDGPVRCVETSSSATFKKLVSYTLTVTNTCNFDVVLDTDNEYDKDIVVPANTAAASPAKPVVYSLAVSLKNDYGGLVVFKQTGTVITLSPSV